MSIKYPDTAPLPPIPPQKVCNKTDHAWVEEARTQFGMEFKCSCGAVMSIEVDPHTGWVTIWTFQPPVEEFCEIHKVLYSALAPCPYCRDEYRSLIRRATRPQARVVPTPGVPGQPIRIQPGLQGGNLPPGNIFHPGGQGMAPPAVPQPPEAPFGEVHLDAWPEGGPADPGQAPF